MPFDTSKRLSIIVPYRDRAAHLQAFVPHILKYFARDKVDHRIRYALTFVEQGNDLPFNTGLLKNIGFLLTEDFDYHCFHDIDFLPIWADYSFPTCPSRLLWHGAQHRPVAPGSTTVMYVSPEVNFGGVVLFTREDFRRVNGYSNEYWGWGAEDDDLRGRCLVEGLRIEHRDGTFEPIHHVSRGFDEAGKDTAESVKHQALLIRKREQQRLSAAHRKDGLGSAAYEVVDESFLGLKDKPKNLLSARKFTVRIAPEPNLSWAVTCSTMALSCTLSGLLRGVIGCPTASHRTMTSSRRSRITATFAWNARQRLCIRKRDAHSHQ